IGGDFSAVMDTALDRSSKPLAWDEKNSQALRSLCKEGCLYDAWCNLNPGVREYTSYSAVHKSYARLDTFLILYSIMMNLLECRIGSFTFSDHAPVVMAFLPEPDLIKTKYWWFNNTLLRDTNFIEMMQKEITEFFQNNIGLVAAMTTVWDSFKAHCRGQVISYATNKKRERIKCRQALEEDLEKIERSHVLDPKNGQLFLDWQLAKSALQAHLEKETEYALFRMRKKYFESGDKAGTLLARSLKKRDSLYVIPRIRTQAGGYTSNTQLINREFEEFYRKLYNSQSKLDQAKVKELLKKANLPKISEEDQARLEEPITTEEVVEAIKRLSSGKAP
uniref:Endonuclease/exonuclease/phosphatase domain-containing protein n=1 Tax=Latimeria chalumnae TaxID=7897 RepID=H2ZVA7_LATCH